jgi:hypothetical protein
MVNVGNIRSFRGPRICPCQHSRTGPHRPGRRASAAGCAKIFSEKASGARGDRAELARVIKRLQPGDVLVVTRLDRLARSTPPPKGLALGWPRAAGSWASSVAPCGRFLPSGITSLPAIAAAASGRSPRVLFSLLWLIQRNPFYTIFTKSRRALVMSIFGVVCLAAPDGQIPNASRSATSNTLR